MAGDFFDDCFVKAQRGGDETAALLARMSADAARVVRLYGRVRECRAALDAPTLLHATDEVRAPHRAALVLAEAQYEAAKTLYAADYPPGTLCSDGPALGIRRLADDARAAPIPLPPE